MTLQWLLGWWNLVFLVPFGIALTYLFVYVSTGIGFGEADADHDLEVDHDIDADHDLDTDADADHDADAHDSDHEQETHGSNRGAMSMLHLIGFGRIPLSMLVMIFLITWGIAGFATCQVLHKTIAGGDRVGLTALPIAAAISIVLTAVFARLLGRTMPMNERPATSIRQLVGSEGVAILPITDAFGLANVRDDRGTGHQVPCRLSPGQPPIEANEPVRLMRFDRQERLFYVTTPQRLAALRDLTQ